MPLNLLIFGLGYSGRAIAREAVAAGLAVTATVRDLARRAEAEVEIVEFEAAEAVVGQADYLITTAAPDQEGDPVLRRCGGAIVGATALRWIGYLSTTGVYGDRDGGWVDEDSAPAPGAARAERRVAAEREWGVVAAGRALDIFRLAGIYGPGRSVFDDLRAGEARRIVKPGHAFSRIHRDDIAAGVVRALRQDPPPGRRVFNFADDVPAASADVVVEAARLLGVEPPPAVEFAAALPGMGAMARSFWGDNRRVANAKTKAALGMDWRYPNYREGLAAILAEEREQGIA